MAPPAGLSGRSRSSLGPLAPLLPMATLRAVPRWLSHPDFIPYILPAAVVVLIPACLISALSWLEGRRPAAPAELAPPPSAQEALWAELIANGWVDEATPSGRLSGGATDSGAQSAAGDAPAGRPGGSVGRRGGSARGTASLWPAAEPQPRPPADPLLASMWEASWAAYGRLAGAPGAVRRTPLEPAPALTAWPGAPTAALDASPTCAGPSGLGAACLYLKLESEQVGGSFKARGATNAVLSVPAEALASGGVIGSSSGNHGVALAAACARLGTPGGPVVPTLYVPESISPLKAARIAAAGGALVRVPGDCVVAERAARAAAAAAGARYVSPYNDADVVAGQGTVALELLAQLPRGRLDVVFVPVGGGGLVAGVAAVLKAVDARIRVVGCQPAASDVMARSVAAGRVLDLDSEPTLSDGTAGGLEEDAITLQPCMRYVDEWVTVSESQIAAAMRAVLDTQAKLIEGAAGVAVAAFLALRPRLRGLSCAVVVCGGNVAAATLAKVLAETSGASSA